LERGCCRPAKERLTVTEHGLAVVALPGGADRGAQLVRSVPLGAQTPVSLPGGCEAAQLPVLVDGIHDPVDAGILRQKYFPGQSAVPFRGTTNPILNSHARSGECLLPPSKTDLTHAGLRTELIR
jgi:hypothetical protein